MPSTSSSPSSSRVPKQSSAPRERGDSPPRDDSAPTSPALPASPEASDIGRYNPSLDPRWLRVPHRITGVAIFAFVLICVWFGTLLRLSPDTFDTAVGYLQSSLGVAGCVVLFAALLFHALNAVRIALVDLSMWGERNQRALVSAVGVLWVALVVCGAYLITRHTLLEMFGGS